MMRNFLKYCFLFLILAEAVYAGPGSVYTRHGIGDIYLNFSARRLAVGGLGFALADEHNLSTLNPANWHRLALTRLELGVDYRGLQVKDKTNSAFYPEYAFSGFVLGFPVDKDLGIATVIGIVPATRVAY